MAKKIQQAKKPLSWFLIICLINTLIFGSSFVFNFKLSAFNLSSISQVFAQSDTDTASTTVEIENTAPVILAAAENPVSSSTSPINLGSNISFQVTADDNENNDYYLVICSSNSVTAHNGSAPTCVATTYCTSATTTDNTQASCTHGTTGETSETYAWYAFACDYHTTQSKCSSVNSGTGDSGSPYYVNHPPQLYSVSTTVNNQEPGGTFTMTTVSEDNDSADGRDDTLTLYVCDNNGGAVYGVGCNSGQLCTSSGATSSIACNYNDVAPTDDISYTYYAYVYDNFSMVATSAPVSSTYTVANIAPTVTSVTLNNGLDIQPNLKTQTATSVNTMSLSVEDLNLCTDLSGGSAAATATIYLSDVAGGASCTADPNNCYQLNAASCAITNCVGAVANVTCTTTLEHYITPTDNATGNPNEPDSWFSRISVRDDNGANGEGSFTTPDPGGVDVMSVLGIHVNEAEIDYGVLRAGTSTKEVNGTTTIVNYGNNPINTNVQGTDMDRTEGGGYSIGANQQEWSLSPFLYSTGTDLASTSWAEIFTVIGRPTSGTDVSDEIYWGIYVPLGLLAGVYDGYNSFVAVLDETGW